MIFANLLIPQGSNGCDEKDARNQENEITRYLNEEKWGLIDCEWTFDKTIETREIAFRALYCYLLEDEKRNGLNPDLIMEKLKIDPTEAEQYRRQEMKFQKYVTGKRLSMAEIRGGHRTTRLQTGGFLRGVRK